jgi:dGTPase
MYARQQELLQELVAVLVHRGGRDLEPWLAPDYAATSDEAGRLRVIIDQVASLTDVSVVHWHERLCHSGLA